VTVLTLNEGLYEESVFEGDQAIVSLVFPQLQLTPDRVFTN